MVRSPCLPHSRKWTPNRKLVADENRREHEKVRLIASENYASRAVMEATGSCLTNKYSEGYAHKRYYEGQQVVDQVEELAIARLTALFGAASTSSNVQPYSGSPANLAVYLAFCQAGDTIMGLALPAGGPPHARARVSITGKYFKSVPYGVRRTTTASTWTRCASSRREHRPKLIWCGTTAYPRTLDFAAFRADRRRGRRNPRARTSRTSRASSARGAHPSPVGIADVVTSTTHKTFRGPRGGMIFCKKQHAAAIDKRRLPRACRAGRTTTRPRRSRSRRARRRAPTFKTYARAHRREREGRSPARSRRAASAWSPAGRTTTCCSST